MKNLTEQEIEKIVNDAMILFEMNCTTHRESIGAKYYLASDVLKHLRTTLRTVQIDRVAVDLREVERIVSAYSEGEYDETIKIEACKNHWRKVIGYTLDDLKP